MEDFNSALATLKNLISSSGRGGQQPQPRNALALNEGSFNRQFDGNQANPYEPSTDVGLGGVMLGTAGRLAQDTLGLKSNPLDDAKGSRVSAPAGDAFHNTITNLAAMPGHIIDSLKRGNDYMMGRYPSQLTLDAQYGDSAPTAYRPFEDVLNVATALPAAGAPAALMREGSSAGIFGGKLAKTADHNALAKAQEMTSQGIPREQVWNDTGWFQGVDKQWRHEIDDSGAQSSQTKALNELYESKVPNADVAALETKIMAQKPNSVAAAFDHPGLYESYPDVGKMKFKKGDESYAGEHRPRQLGGFLPEQLSVSDLWDNSTFLHELQHATQQREGFAMGNSPENIAFDTMFGGGAKGQLKALGQGIKNRSLAFEIPPNIYDAAAEQYRAHAGEVEARTIEKRQHLTAEERRARPPWLDYDVPEDQQIVRFGSNGPPETVVGDPRDIRRSDAAFDPKRRSSANLLASNPSDAKTVGLFGAMNTATEKPGITAYHGSPHDFDRFSLDKIGTGEGAQAYGHGLYFADSEGVAKSYRDALSDYRGEIDGKPLDYNDPRHVVAVDLSGKKSREDILRGYRTQIELERSPDRAGSQESKQRSIDHYQKLIDVLESGNIPEYYKNSSTGRMYQVRINADPEHFLDWDKPLSQQSERVRQAVPPDLHSLPGHEAYQKLTQRQREGTRTGDPLDDVLFDIPITDHPQAGQRLREAGVPGIKYLDQGSRAAGEGSRNYVVFDDKIIDIVKKYGIAAAATMYGMDRVMQATSAQAAPANPSAAAPLAAANDHSDFDAQLAALSKLVWQNR